MNDNCLQLKAAVGKAVIGRHRPLFKRNGSLLMQRRRQGFHVRVVLIVGFDEQYWANS